MTSTNPIEKAQELQEAGKLSEALHLLENHLKSLSPEQRDERLSCLNELSNCLWRQGRLVEAESQAKEALRLADTIPVSFQGQGDALQNLGTVFWRAGDINQAKAYWQRSLVIREKIGDLSDIADSLNNLAAAYWAQGDLVQTEKLLRRSLKLRKQLDEPQQIAMSLNNLGEVYRHQRSMELREKIGSPQDMADSLNNLGQVYWQRGELNRAEDHYQRSLTLKEEIGNPQDIADCLTNLALVCWQKAELEEAEKLLRRSLALRGESGNPQEIAETRYGLVRILLTRNNLEEALSEAEQLDALAQTAGVPEILVKQQLATGLIYLKQHELKSAFETGCWAKAQAEQLPHFELRIDATIFLIEVLLELYLLTSTKKVVYEYQIRELIQELQDLSHRQRLYRTHVEAAFLRGLFLRVAFDLPGAIEQLERVQHEADKRGLRSLAEKAQNELKILKERTTVFEEMQRDFPTAFLHVNIEKLVVLIKSMQGTTEYPSSFDPSKVFLMVIRVGTSGAEILVSEDLPFKETNLEEFFHRVSNLYALALGQGQLYYEGLYGPLPLTESYSSLVYARILPDSTQEDPRLDKKAYALICLGYPRDQDHIFGDRKALTRMFYEWTSKIGELSQLDLKSLSKLRKTLRKSIT
jgi:tetratricopeptide (TPR) repeat protein